MKSFVISLLLAAVLIGCGIFHQVKFEAAADELTAVNDKIIDGLNREDFPDAMSAINELSGKVERFELFFAALGNHDEIDSIELCISELRGYTQGELKYDALSQAYSLSFLLEHLPRNSRVRIENIF